MHSELHSGGVTRPSDTLGSRAGKTNPHDGALRAAVQKKRLTERNLGRGVGRHGPLWGTKEQTMHYSLRNLRRSVASCCRCICGSGAWVHKRKGGHLKSKL